MKFHVPLLLLLTIPLPASRLPFPQRAIRTAPRPLIFEPNTGQTDRAALFLARARGFTLFHAAGETVLASRDSVVRMKLAGGHPSRTIRPEAPTGGLSNYLIGNDPTRWRRDIPHYAALRTASVYDGIDLLWHGQAGSPEYDFLIHPGANPSAIRIAFEGAAARIAANGDLLLRTAHGEFRHTAPRIEQHSDQGERRTIAGRYRIDPAGQVCIEILSAYDHSRQLVIDPVISWATFLGGAEDDEITELALDANNNVYVAGFTNTLGFPTTTGALKTTAPGCGNPGFDFECDAVIAKLDPTGSRLLYSTYLGGKGADIAFALAVDSTGAAYVGGRSDSTDLPVPPDSIGPRAQGFTDGFVFKLNPAGNTVVYGAYFGGDSFDSVTGIRVDSTGNAYIAGQGGGSRIFPITPTPGAFDTSLSGLTNIFLVKLNPAGSRALYATYLGGNSAESDARIAVDANGAVYVAGDTSSSNFPVTEGALDRQGGFGDIFVAKLNPAGSALVYAARFGGPGRDHLKDIAIDSAGNAFVTGETTINGGFPTTPGAFDTTYNNGDAFVTKLNAAGTAMIYSTLLAGGRGGGFTSCRGIAVDAAGLANLACYTNSSDFPVTADALDRESSFDAEGVYVKLNASGSALAYATKIGGGDGQVGTRIAIDAAGAVYLAGDTGREFPVTAGAYQTTHGGNFDFFVLKLTDPPPTPQPAALTAVNAASFAAGPLAPASIATAFGTGFSTASEIAGAPLPTVLAGSSVRVRDSAGTARLAQLIYVYPTQLSFLVSAATAAGTATIEVLRSNQVVARGTATIERVAPALFTANASGSGVPAALILRVAANGAQTTQNAFDCPAAGQCVPAVIAFGPAAEQMVLLLFGTGIRGATAQSAVSASIGGLAGDVLYSGDQGQFAGLDQVNVRVPRQLAGRGEVTLTLTVDGKSSNPVRVRFQ